MIINLKRKPIIECRRKSNTYILYDAYIIFGIPIKKEYKCTLTEEEATNWMEGNYHVGIDFKLSWKE